MAAKLKVTQVKSTISHIARNRATVRALGLHGIGSTSVITDNPATRGMVRQVRFLVTVEEIADSAATTRQRRLGEVMKLHDLRPADGSRQPRTRVGRGIAAGKGKTAGRGTKGQKARAGGSIPPWFEGGQTPLHMRIPKLRGFKNRFKIEYEVVNVGAIGALADRGAFEAEKPQKGAKAGPITVNQDILRAVGLVRTLNKPLKILGAGELTRPALRRRRRVHGFAPGARSRPPAAASTCSRCRRRRWPRSASTARRPRGRRASRARPPGGPQPPRRSVLARRGTPTRPKPRRPRPSKPPSRRRPRRRPRPPPTDADADAAGSGGRRRRGVRAEPPATEADEPPSAERVAAHDRGRRRRRDDATPAGDDA